MIITVGSQFADNSDANDFVNYFPDGLIIKPKSEIGLLNCTYQIEQGFVVTQGIDDTFEYSFPPYNNLLTVTVQPGEYSLEGLATAVENALKLAQITEAITNPQTAGLVQTTGIHCTADTTNSKLKLLSVYNPVSTPEQSSFTNGANPNSFKRGDLSGGLTQTGTGINKSYYFKNSAVDTYASNHVVTSDGGSNIFEAYAFGLVEPKDANKFYHQTRFKVGQADAELAVALGTNILNDPTTMPFGIKCNSDGTFNIFELVAGVVTNLTIAAGTNTYVAGDTFFINLPYQTTGQPRNLLYYKLGVTPGSQPGLIDVSGSSARGNPDPNADFTPCASIKSPALVGKLETATNILSKPGGLLSSNAINITTPGTGYIDREICTITGSAGDNLATFVIRTTVNGNLIETPAQFRFLTRGSGYVANEVLTLTGLVSGANNARLTALGNGIFGEVFKNSAGTGYTVGEQLTDIIGGSNIQLEVVSVDPHTGGITEVSIIQGTTGEVGDQYAFNTPITFSNASGGASFVCSFRNDIDTVPYFQDLTFRGLVKNPSFHPLQQVNLQQFRGTNAASISNLLGFPVSKDGPGQNGNLEIEGEKIVGNNRTANNMLVHIDSFPLKSRHIGGEGRCVMALPFGSNDNSQIGLFSDRNFNLTYHSLENEGDENHNMMRVRITDARGNKLQGIQHPVVMNFDLRPKSL